MCAVGPEGISRRAAEVAESATMAITAKAKALRAAGEPVIGYGAGEPDFPTPDHIVAAAVEAARDPKMHKYSPASGLPELREAIVQKTIRDSSFATELQHVVVTNGGKQAVYLTCQVLLDAGDEVLLPAPYWVTYPEAVKLADAVPVVIPTDDSTGYRVTVEQLEAARTPETKMLIFVSPSNPTGAVYTPDEVRAIGEWAVEHDIWVMTDEIYEHLVYGKTRFSSLPVEVPELAERCVIVNGVAKTYAMTGWRVGWLIGPESVAKAAGKLTGHMTSNVSNVSQRAALEAISGPLDSALAMRAAFDRRRRTMHTMLNDVEGVVCLEPEGAFYAFPNMTGLLNRDLGGRRATTTLELASLVLDEIQVAFIPGEAFGAPGYARFSFALADEDLEEGLQRLQVLAAG
ncbi:MAG: pyridoxal phosphate-dependent aminotransferase [Actinomycetota bacterium]|nr:pyridoxal phosphate-dependent aminotransferase [Actinomycetota bacterium]